MSTPLALTPGAAAEVWFSSGELMQTPPLYQELRRTMFGDITSITVRGSDPP
jgi:hypothetical protein